MLSEESAAVDELLLSRQFANGKRMELHRVAGELVVRLFNAQGSHYGSHVGGDREDVMRAVLHWDGAGHPFVE